MISPHSCSDSLQRIISKLRSKILQEDVEPRSKAVASTENNNRVWDENNPVSQTLQNIKYKQISVECAFVHMSTNTKNMFTIEWEKNTKVTGR